MFAGLSKRLGGDISKELWVEEYERLEAENEGLDDATLSDMAMDAVMNKLAWMADSRRDRAKHEDPQVVLREGLG